MKSIRLNMISANIDSIKCEFSEYLFDKTEHPDWLPANPSKAGHKAVRPPSSWRMDTVKFYGLFPNHAPPHGGSTLSCFVYVDIYHNQFK